MRSNTIRLTDTILAILLLAAVSMAAPAADLSGSWNVNGDVFGNPVKYALTLKQDGDKLSGTALLDGKDRPVTGTITDKAVTWTFESEYNGSPLKIDFSGTVTSDADMKGTISVMGAEGQFTAERQ